MLRTLCLVSLLLVAALSGAQSSSVADAMAKKADEIYLAMYKVQIMNQILPLVMEKEQIRKLLPPIEKVRQRVTEYRKAEYQQLLNLEKPTNMALSEALASGKMPAKETIDKIGQHFVNSGLIRTQIAQENVDSVLTVFKATLNKGQLKAAANSLTLQFYEPDVKPEQATEEFRLRVFVREVLLDPITYDLLITMMNKK
jgi:hypothetical protein